MKTTERENFMLIENETGSLTSFASELTRNHDKIEGWNVIVDIKDQKDLDADQILGFLEISNYHRNKDKSFVIVNDSIAIDELPEELIVVPTMQEAEDMIQMDEIQRDLGF